MVNVIVGPGYIQTYPGVMKLLQLLFSLIGFIIVLASGLDNRGKAFLAASIGAMTVSTFFIIVYVSKAISKGTYTWLRAEMFFGIIWAIFYLIVSSLVLATLWNPYIAAGVFGLLATIVLLADALHKYTAT